MRRLKVFTWHIHGAYLLYLSQIPHDIYIPVSTEPTRTIGYGGKVGTVARMSNVHEIPVQDIRKFDFDCIIFQSPDAYVTEQFEIFSSPQLKLPKIYLEHDPPRQSPTDTKHIVADPNTFLVHVTDYNSLMWDSGKAQKRTIKHGVFIGKPTSITPRTKAGITVINHLRNRGRRLGCDIFLQVRNEIPIDLIGMDAESLGGLGEIEHGNLPTVLAAYRYLFHPVRYTSLALAVCEAMSLALPVVGLATTELPMVIENEVSGYLSNNVDELICVMKELNSHPELAEHWGQAAKKVAQERFNIARFVQNWNEVLAFVTR